MKRLVHKEILLFPSQRCHHLGNVLIEVLAYRCGGIVDPCKRLEKRRFVVQCETCVTNKYRRNAQGLSPNKCRRGRIPQRVASRLKRVANASIWERARVWLLLNEQGTVKLLDHLTIGYRCDKTVVLFGCRSSQRLKPVGIVRRTARNRPFLHRRGYLVCNRSADGRVIFHGVDDAIACFVR